MEELRSPSPKWFADLSASAKKEFVVSLAEGTLIDYPRTCIGVGIHAAFEHMTDIFDLLPWDQASKVVEEAFDYLFSYLYHVVPAVANRSLLTARNATTTWMVILESHAAGIPAMTARGMAAQIHNSAYL